MLATVASKDADLVCRPSDEHLRRITSAIRAWARLEIASDFSASVSLKEWTGCSSLIRLSFSRAVAQLGRAPRSGRGGRGFESRRPDHAENEQIKERLVRNE
jgi:hypothetical protein